MSSQLPFCNAKLINLVAAQVLPQTAMPPVDEEGSAQDSRPKSDTSTNPKQESSEEKLHRACSPFKSGSDFASNLVQSTNPQEELLAEKKLSGNCPAPKVSRTFLEHFEQEPGNVAEKIIGPEGGVINFHSYKIQIPPKAVRDRTAFKFCVSLGRNLAYPEDLIPISALLFCSPGDINFGAAVRMKIPTYTRLRHSSEPVIVCIYSKRKGGDWQHIASSNLSAIGDVEYECRHFCVHAAFISKSDVDRVKFALEHILFKDNFGTYTSCHFFASDALASSMLQCLGKNYEIVHPPMYTSLVKAGDELLVSLVSSDPKLYRFVPLDGCVLKIDEDFFTINRRESISFLLTPKHIPVAVIEFTYQIGEKKFLHCDKINQSAEAEQSDDNPAQTQVIITGGSFPQAQIGQIKSTTITKGAMRAVDANAYSRRHSDVTLDSEAICVAELIDYLTRVLDTLPQADIHRLSDELGDRFEVRSSSDLRCLNATDLESLQTLRRAQIRKLQFHLKESQ